MSVGANQSISVGKDRSVTVGGKETTKITLLRDETVNGGESVKITNGRSHEIVTADDGLEVTAGSRFVEVAHLHKLDAEDLTAVIKKVVDIAGGQKITFHHGADAGLDLTAGAGASRALLRVARLRARGRPLRRRGRHPARRHDGPWVKRRCEERGAA